MTSTDNNGLGLFDDTASAVGNFPSALRGYDRNAVDDYVRSLEGTLVGARRRGSELEREVATIVEQLEQARAAANDVDYTNLGGRASDILRLAEEQARETLDRAGVEAEKLREEARRHVDEAKLSATREGDELKATGLAEIEEIRSRTEEEGRAQAERHRAEAEALIAAARRQAESMQKEAEHEAETARQQAYLQAEEVKRAAEREAADVRQQIATERETAISELRRVAEETATRTSELLAEATRHNQESAERLEADIAQANTIRADALAEAEKVQLAALKEAEERVDAAKAQAAAITERTQSEFAWRKQELKRETDLLSQRKQAVLNQLASLSALAQQTAQSFPEIDDLTEFDGEDGDRTVLQPAGSAPALPREDKTEDKSEDKSERTGDHDQPASGHDPEVAVEDDPTERPFRPDSSSGHGHAGQPDLDGDATIVIPAGAIPSGTSHLKAERDS